MNWKALILSLVLISCKPRSLNESVGISELLKTKWNSPAKNISIQLTDISGKSTGPYKIRSNLYFLGSNFKLGQKDYIDDPEAPFLHHLRWVICDDLADFKKQKITISRKNCRNQLAPRPNIFPETIEFELEQISHNNNNVVLYTNIISKDSRLTYYYPADSNEDMKPFAIDALLDRSTE